MGEVYVDFASTNIRLVSKSIGTHKTLCPRCSAIRRNKLDPCLSVTIRNANDIVWLCHNCGWSGGTQKTNGTNGHKVAPANRIIVKPDIHPVDPDQDIIDWFAKRKISAATIKRNKIFGLTYPIQMTLQRAIAFPYVRGGEIVHVKYRSIDRKSFTSTKNTQRIFYNYDACDGAEEVVIVEGEIDALSFQEAGITNVISVPNGAPQQVAPEQPDPDADNAFNYVWNSVQLFANKKKIYLATDADAPGQALAEELARRLGKERCWRVRWPTSGDVECKDANEALTIHGPQALRDAITAAEPWPISGVYEASAFFDQTLDLYRSGRSRGLSTGWEELDELMTIRPGEVSVVTGAPGSGKSAIVDALTYNLAVSANWRIGVCSFENPPDEHLSKLAELHDGRPFRQGPNIRMTEPELRAALNWINKRFFFIRLDEDEAPTIETILNKARVLVIRHGIRGLVVDPWGELENSREKFVNETTHIAQSLTKIRQFARNHGVHVWIIAHPAKMMREGNQIPEPTLYDIAGSASFFNKCDIGFIVHRDRFDRDHNVDIIVQKVRFRAVGRPGRLRMRYNMLNNRYFVPEADDPPEPRNYDGERDSPFMH